MTPMGWTAGVRFLARVGILHEHFTLPIHWLNLSQREVDLFCLLMSLECVKLYLHASYTPSWHGALAQWQGARPYGAVHLFWRFPLSHFLCSIYFSSCFNMISPIMPFVLYFDTWLQNVRLFLLYFVACHFTRLSQGSDVKTSKRIQFSRKC
jgi:hypothetical protein